MDGTMVVLHVGVLYCLLRVVFRAPCILQILALAFMIVGFAMLVVAHAVHWAGALGWWIWKQDGYEAIVIGVMIYAFRLWFVERVLRIHWHPRDLVAWLSENLWTPLRRRVRSSAG